MIRYTLSNNTAANLIVKIYDSVDLSLIKIRLQVVDLFESLEDKRDKKNTQNWAAFLGCTKIVFAPSRTRRDQTRLRHGQQPFHNSFKDVLNTYTFTYSQILKPMEAILSEIFKVTERWPLDIIYKNWMNWLKMIQKADITCHWIISPSLIRGFLSFAFKQPSRERWRLVAFYLIRNVFLYFKDPRRSSTTRCRRFSQESLRSCSSGGHRWALIWIFDC